MKDKVVIITGASSGIGKALAFLYAEKQSNVVIGARSHEKLTDIAEEIKLRGGQAVIAQTDVTNESDCKNLVMTALEHYGRVDVLINNAGISMRALVEKVDLEVIRRLMEVNFWGMVYCTRHALPHLLETGGSIVGVSSIAGITGLPGRSGYSASKFAMKGFLDCVRTENRKKGLHVLMAYPGFTASNIRVSSLTGDGTPQGESPREEDKMMTAEEVALKIYRAVEKRRNSLVLTFEGKATVFLSKFAPRLLERMVYNKMAREPDSPFK
jgi:short-subunit dehydrogenase